MPFVPAFQALRATHPRGQDAEGYCELEAVIATDQARRRNADCM